MRLGRSVTRLRAHAQRQSALNRAHDFGSEHRIPGPWVIRHPDGRYFGGRESNAKPLWRSRGAAWPIGDRAAAEKLLATLPEGCTIEEARP